METFGYVDDLAEVVAILNTAVTRTLLDASKRVITAFDEDTFPVLQLDRHDRKRLFLHLAIYGNALSRAMCAITFNITEMPVPSSLFVILATIAGAERVPVILGSQAGVALTGLLEDLRNDNADVRELTPYLSTAFLEKHYTDVAD